ncbi:hypothetical protein J4526_06745 [Desulfurococcaceae archaeon MEX13E-LK6-19]|nr:hypothetical protein J4526_06745 [Desulfurococcaceae archaeon MEX13E-LK6-19]
MVKLCIVVKKIFFESIMDFAIHAKSAEEVYEYIRMLEEEVKKYPKDNIDIVDARNIIKTVNEKFRMKKAMGKNVAS